MKSMFSDIEPPPGFFRRRPGEARRGQERPGEARRGQERPGEATRGPERPGEARRGQERPGEARRSQETPEKEERPGEARRGQERLGEARRAVIDCFRAEIGGFNRGTAKTEASGNRRFSSRNRRI